MLIFGSRRVTRAVCTLAAVATGPGLVGLVSVDVATARALAPSAGGLASFPPGYLMDKATGRCLASNYQGAVYASLCSANDRFQRWQLDAKTYAIFKDELTGRCLTSDPDGSVETDPCVSLMKYGYEFWLFPLNIHPLTHASWYEDFAGRCLDDNGVYVFVNSCNNGSSQEWWGSPAG